MQTAKPANSVQMTSVVILNSRPSRVGTTQFSDDHLAREVTGGGRLDRLIKAADADNVSFAIDPALIDELRTMKSGYSVIGSDASTDKGQSAATRWLEKFESVKSTRDGFQLLYGSPDIAALVHSNETKLLTQGELAARTVEGVSTLPVLVFPAGGTADAETLAAAEDLEPAAILLSDISTGELRPLLTAPGKAPVVSFTAGSFGGGPGPDPETPQYTSSSGRSPRRGSKPPPHPPIPPSAEFTWSGAQPRPAPAVPSRPVRRGSPAAH